MNSARGSALIILILILGILLGITGFFAYKNYFQKFSPSGQESVNQTTQTTEPSPFPAGETADWKTYTSIQNSFSVKYPPDWDSLEASDGSLNGLLIASADRIELHRKAGDRGLRMSTSDIMTIYTRDDDYIRAAYGDYMFEDKTIKIEKSGIIVDGRNATKYEISALEERSLFPAGTKLVKVIIKNKEHYLEITLNNVQFLDIFNKIISTFKFTD